MIMPKYINIILYATIVANIVVVSLKGNYLAILGWVVAILINTQVIVLIDLINKMRNPPKF